MRQKVEIDALENLTKYSCYINFKFRGTLSRFEHISCGYTRLLPKVTQWVIALGWDRFGFLPMFNSPVTLQIITQGQLLTWRYLAGNLIRHGGDRKLRNVWLACGRSSVSYAAIPSQITMPH